MLGSNDRWRVPGGKRKFRQRMERLADDPGDVYRFSIQSIDRSSRVRPYVQNGSGGATIWTTIDIKRWIDRALRAEREFVARRYSNRCRSVISDFISRFDWATGFFFFFLFFFVRATCFFQTMQFTVRWFFFEWTIIPTGYNFNAISRQWLDWLFRLEFYKKIDFDVGKCIVNNYSKFDGQELFKNYS